MRSAKFLAIWFSCMFLSILLLVLLQSIAGQLRLDSGTNIGVKAFFLGTILALYLRLPRGYVDAALFIIVGILCQVGFTLLASQSMTIAEIEVWKINIVCLVVAVLVPFLVRYRRRPDSRST